VIDDPECLFIVDDLFELSRGAGECVKADTIDTINFGGLDIESLAKDVFSGLSKVT